MLLRKVRRALRSAGQRSGNREDDRAVGVANVPLGSLQVGSRRRLGELVLRRDLAVFGLSALGTPAAVRDVAEDGPSRGLRGQRRFGRRRGDW